MNAGGSDSQVLIPGTGTTGLPFGSLAESDGQPVVRFEYLRRKGSGLVYTPVGSIDLIFWFPLSATPAVTDIDAEWERAVVEEPIDLESMPQAFGRVEVSLP